MVQVCDYESFELIEVFTLTNGMNPNFEIIDVLNAIK